LSTNARNCATELFKLADESLLFNVSFVHLLAAVESCVTLLQALDLLQIQLLDDICD